MSILDAIKVADQANECERLSLSGKNRLKQLRECRDLYNKALGMAASQISDKSDLILAFINDWRLKIQSLSRTIDTLRRKEEMAEIKRQQNKIKSDKADSEADLEVEGEGAVVETHASLFNKLVQEPAKTAGDATKIAVTRLQSQGLISD